MKAFYKPIAIKNGETLSLDKCVINAEEKRISQINYKGQILPFVKDVVSVGGNINNYFDNIDLPLKKVVFKGAASQNSYVGYNHLKQNYKTCALNSSVSINDLNIMVDEVGNVRMVGQPTALINFIVCDEEAPLVLEVGKTYYLYSSSNAKSGKISVELIGKNTGEKIVSSSLSVPFTPKEREYTCRIVIKSGSYIFGEIYSPMVTETEQTIFEPYVGLKPSPSHDFPQEIEHVGSEDLEIECSAGVYSYYETIPVENTLISGEKIFLSLAKMGDEADVLLIDVLNGKVLYEKHVDVMRVNSNLLVKKGTNAKYATLYSGYKDVFCNTAQKMAIESPEDIEVDKVAIYGEQIILGYPSEKADSLAGEYFAETKLFGLRKTPRTIDITNTIAGQKLLTLFGRSGSTYFMLDTKKALSESTVYYRILI